MSLMSKLLVSRLLQHSMMSILLIMVPFRVKIERKGVHTLGHGYLFTKAVCPVEISSPVTTSRPNMDSSGNT